MWKKGDWRGTVGVFVAIELQDRTQPGQTYKKDSEVKTGCKPRAKKIMSYKTNVLIKRPRVINSF